MKLDLTIQKQTVRVGGIGYATYRLRGKNAGGDRVRFQNQDRGVVVAEKQRLEIEAANADGEGPRNTHLSHERIREAEGAFQRLARHPKVDALGSQPLTLAVEHFFKTYHPPGTDKKISELVTDYLAAKKKGDQTTKQAATSYYRSLKADLKEFVVAHGEVRPHEFLDAQAYKFMLGRRAIPRGAPRDSEPLPLLSKRWNNFRGTLHAFFAWCQESPRNYIEINPVTKIQTMEVIPKTPKTLSPYQSLRLMEEAVAFRDGILVPYFALTLFAGIRPSLQDGEIRELCTRADFFDLVNVQRGIIHIPGEVSKVGVKRNIIIQPTLLKWMEAFPLDEFPVIPTNATNLIKVVRARCHLGHDIMRHTFISHHIGKFQSMGKTALEAGTSESIIKRHYHNPASEAEAALFWRITPAAIADAHRRMELADEMHLEEAKKSRVITTRGPSQGDILSHEKRELAKEGIYEDREAGQSTN